MFLAYGLHVRSSEMLFTGYRHMNQGAKAEVAFSSKRLSWSHHDLSIPELTEKESSRSGIYYPDCILSSASWFQLLVRVYLLMGSLGLCSLEHGYWWTWVRIVLIDAGVDLRSAKVCELKYVTHMPTISSSSHTGRSKLRCYFDYYWTSVFKVHFLDKMLRLFIVLSCCFICFWRNYWQIYMNWWCLVLLLCRLNLGHIFLRQQLKLQLSHLQKFYL